MNHYWANGPMTIKTLQTHYTGNFIPHVNTLSTIVRGLEEKGWMTHEQMGKTYIYRAKDEMPEAGVRIVRNIAERFFGNDFKSMVSGLVKDEAVSVEELRNLLDEIESQQQK